MLVVLTIGSSASRWSPIGVGEPHVALAVRARGGLRIRDPAVGRAAVLRLRGYARIATLGEEVRDPETTIPRAIPRALAIVVVLYAVVGVVLLAVLGPAGVAASDLPLLAAADQAGVSWMGAPSGWRPSWPASVPCSGSSRASAGRCWRWRANATCRAVLAPVDERRGVPQTAEVAVCAVVVLLVVAFDVRR